MALHSNAREKPRVKARVREHKKEGEIVFIGMGTRGEGRSERDNNKPLLPYITDSCLGWKFVPIYTSAT